MTFAVHLRFVPLAGKFLGNKVNISECHNISCVLAAEQHGIYKIIGTDLNMIPLV